jgi:hypothetical protein
VRFKAHWRGILGDDQLGGRTDQAELWGGSCFFGYSNIIQIEKKTKKTKRIQTWRAVTKLQEFGM